MPREPLPAMRTAPRGHGGVYRNVWGTDSDVEGTDGDGRIRQSGLFERLAVGTGGESGTYPLSTGLELCVPLYVH